MQEKRIPEHRRLYEGKELTRAYDILRPNYPEKVRKEILSCLKTNSSRQRFMLDVGCGGGKSTKLFAKDFDQILGIDISQSQIELARKNVVESNIRFEIVHDNVLPLKSHPVDLVLCAATLHHLDISVFMSECDRVLVPGGVLACVNYDVDYLKTSDGRLIAKNVPGSKIKKLHWDFLINCAYDKSALECIQTRYENIFNSIKNPHKQLKYITTVDMNFNLDLITKLFSTVAGYMNQTYPDPERDPLNIYRKGVLEILQEAGLEKPENNDFVLGWVFWAMIIVKTSEHDVS